MLSQTITTFVETITTTTAQVVAQAIIKASALESMYMVSHAAATTNTKQARQKNRLSTKKKSQAASRKIKSLNTQRQQTD